jgi:uncharacterized protein (TIGR04255 family)
VIQQRHLPNAPIKEALIDVHVETRPGLTVQELERRAKESDFGYYVKGPISEGVFGIKLTPDGRDSGVESSTSQVGLRLHSTDECYVLQWRLTGFTLSRLPPYQDWPHLKAEAERLWPIYVSSLGPRQIKRIATRYINDLQLPLEDGATFDRFIDTLVDVPEGTPQVVGGFLQRFQLVDNEANARVNLTVAWDGTTRDARVAVILDIDAFTGVTMEPASPALWETLERLRGLKNRVFFSVITEAAAELYR